MRELAGRGFAFCGNASARVISNEVRDLLLVLFGPGQLQLCCLALFKGGPPPALLESH